MNAFGTSRRDFLKLGLAAGALLPRADGAAPATAPASSGETIALGGARQLFFDDRLVDLAQTHGVKRALQPPKEIRRVLVADQPWQALGFIFYCGVVDDGHEIKLYHGSFDAEKKRHFGLVTSQDGVHWERPVLGQKAFAGSKENNLFAMEAVEAGVFLDPHAPPEKRYRLVHNRFFPDPEKAGVYLASSPDGIHWKEGDVRLLPFIPDNQPSAFWDERIGKYAIYLRTWNPVRAVARVEVEEIDKPWPYDASQPPFLAWGKGKIPTPSRELPMVMAVDAQDPPEQQLYTSVAAPYPYAPETYFAFPAAYLLYKGAEWKARQTTTNDGPFDVQFASSRDGIAWERWRDPYVATGLQEGLDLRLVSMGTGMVRRGTELFQYFVGLPYTHGVPTAWENDLELRAAWLGRDRGGIYRAVQRVDGFVAREAKHEPGVLTTKPLTFAGNRLRLNIHTAGSGRAQVALLHADGSPIAGFGAEDCEVINADAIDYEVRWSGGADVSALAGQALRVQFSLRNARLYALQFGVV